MFMRGKVKLMAKFYYFLVFAASTLCFCPLAYASEDTASPFPDGMVISDLPELTSVSENVSETTPVASLNVTDNVDITPENIKNENHEISNPMVSDIQTGAILESDITESEKTTPIFLPPQNKK